MNSWEKIFQERKMTADEAISHIKDNQSLVVSHVSGAPDSLSKALADHYMDFNDLHIISMQTRDGQPYAAEKCKGHFHITALFVSPGVVDQVEAGNVEFAPVHFSKVPELIKGKFKPDVALIQVSEPDAGGYVSLGLNSDFTYVAAHESSLVIAEVNKQCPYVYGDTILHVSQIDCFVESDRHIYEIPKTIAGETERTIAQYCTELVHDGDCLQIGIGAVPDAVFELMDDKKHLGIHSEIIGDSVMKLAKLGVIDGSRKEIDCGKIVATDLYGSNALNRWADHNDQVRLRTVDYCNNPAVIAQISNMVSINSCVEIDMTGQICSEAFGIRQISGCGGQIDFVRGAQMSKGGRSIIATYSTARKGTVSRIVPVLKPGTPVTTSRNDVDYFITEYGVARLKGMTLHERARALIKLAHPTFRDQLKYDYEKIYGWKL